MKTNNIFFALIAILITMTACQKDNGFTSDDTFTPDLEYGLGGDLDENGEGVPEDLFLGNGNVPSSHDISQFLPPVGHQGNYGTCVAWALGYNLKSALEAQDKNYTTNDMTDPAKRFSAKDLFLSIDNSNKVANCDGTWLEYAMDAMQKRGIATEATVPYTNLGDCSQGPSAAGTQEAQNYKLSNYRKIDIDVNTIKQYIANDRPVGFGARLGDNFMTWNSDDVITGHTSFDRVGIHAGHAMTVIGYDDSKGFGGAFRVVNSWGQQWGDKGFIWIDYNFFVGGDFCNVAFVGTNAQSEVDPNDPTDPNSNGQIDMVPYGITDNPDQEGQSAKDRTVSYNVYNIGTETARASSDWSVAYVYYNAFDANDYGILLYDYYSDDFGSRGENGEMTSGPGISGNWWNNVDVAGGQSIAQAVSGSNDNFTWDYQIPGITGYYYLVMIADPFQALQEADASNNFFYMTDANGYPIWFENGVPQGLDGNIGTRSSGKDGEQVAHLAPNEVDSDMANAYTKSEIMGFLKHQAETGGLRRKVDQFQNKKQIK
jgi:hypothetical protein